MSCVEFGCIGERCQHELLECSDWNVQGREREGDRVVVKRSLVVTVIVNQSSLARMWMGSYGIICWKWERKERNGRKEGMGVVG